MFHDHDRYQAFCRWCVKVFESDSTLEAVRMAEEHEKACVKAPAKK